MIQKLFIPALVILPVITISRLGSQSACGYHLSVADYVISVVMVRPVYPTDMAKCIIL